MAEELNDRQTALLDQVRAGEVTEQEPDTEVQLLTLARLGHLNAEHSEDGWTFTVPEDGREQPAPEPEPAEG